MEAGLVDLVLLAAATLVSEDLAALAGAALAASSSTPVSVIVAFVGFGIWAGDFGLWALGRYGRRTIGSGRVLAVDLEVVARRVRRHAGLAILVSRFLPGARVPTYVMAGASGVGAARFAWWTFLAVAIWTPVLVTAAAAGGEAAARSLGSDVSDVLALAAIGAVVALVWRSRATLGAVPHRLARLRRWEFWPAWLFYAPVLPWVGYLMLTRGARALTAANPGIEHGGFVGESKSKILSALPREWTLAHTTLEPGASPTRLDALRRHFARTETGYPVVLKPDVGQRGEGVSVVRSDAEAVAYFAAHPELVIAQVHHPGPYEAGVFYYRMPGDASGRIFSLTDKRFPVAVGDGSRTVAAIVAGHRRFRLQRDLFASRLGPAFDRVPLAGEAVPLGAIGNHAQGAIFCDGADLVTDALTGRIDAISRSVDGFYIGRFDVRYRDPRAFMAGTDLAIVELNGATAEATHIYDPSWSVWRAYRTLFEQWRLVFAIGEANVRRGHAGTSFPELCRLSFAHLSERSQGSELGAEHGLGAGREVSVRQGAGKAGDIRSSNPPSLVLMRSSAASECDDANAIASSGPITIRAVDNASARTASSASTVTDASACCTGRPVRGSSTCDSRRPSTSRKLR